MLRSFDTRYKPPMTNMNCVFMNGGVGDHIGSLVAVNHILTNYKWVNLLIWVPDFLLDFAKNVLPPHAIVRNFTSLKEKYNPNHYTVSTEWDQRTSPMKMHVVDYAFLKLCDEVQPVGKKNYLRVDLNKVDITNFALPEKYVVMTTAYTAKVREFPSDTVNRITEYLRAKEYTPVFLGQKQTSTGTKHVIKGEFDEKLDFSKGIDLIDKTTLLQAAKIMAGASAVVGVDNGLMHVAGCTDVPIVGGFTTVKPEMRMPIRHNELGWKFFPVVPEKSLECRFCQVTTNFLANHDYKFCIYDDYVCVKQLTSDKFITELEKIL